MKQLSRLGAAANDFWYSSMRNLPTAFTYSEPSKTTQK